MTEKAMYEKSFERPKNYFTLSCREQWSIDKKLGILDWYGVDLNEEEKVRFEAHYTEVV